jgi:hypothetical protein
VGKYRPSAEKAQFQSDSRCHVSRRVLYLAAFKGCHSPFPDDCDYSRNFGPLMKSLGHLFVRP